MSVRIGSDHPDQLLLPDDFPAGEAVHLGNQREIDFAAANETDERR